MADASAPREAARDALAFPSSLAAPLSPYLPPTSSFPPSTLSSPSSSSSSSSSPNHLPKPFTTLTFATSLDSSLSLAPGTRTALSGPLSKAMTHHLRSTHDAILIGAGTAMADDPSLNCRIEGVGGYGGGEEEPLRGQPRPVVVDARGRWQWCAADGDGDGDGGHVAKVLQLARQGRGRAPWVLVGEGVAARIPAARKAVLEAAGGRVLELAVDEHGAFDWAHVLELLAREGLRSVMVEGGRRRHQQALGAAEHGPRRFSHCHDCAYVVGTGRRRGESAEANDAGWRCGVGGELAGRQVVSDGR